MIGDAPTYSGRPNCWHRFDSESARTNGIRSQQHDCPVPVEEHAPFAVPLHRIGERLALGVASRGHQVLRAEGVIHCQDLLGEDRTLLDTTATISTGSSPVRSR